MDLWVFHKSHLLINGLLVGVGNENRFGNNPIDYG
jgi:hypothetical protein